jgi:hypothetical protein
MSTADDVRLHWAAYDEQEAELWADYAEHRSYLAGRRYLAAESLVRARCERRVQSERYAREDARVAA